MKSVTNTINVLSNVRITKSEVISISLKSKSKDTQKKKNVLTVIKTN